MMNRLAAMFLPLILILLLVACGSDQSDINPSPDTYENPTSTAPPDTNESPIPATPQGTQNDNTSIQTTEPIIFYRLYPEYDEYRDTVVKVTSVEQLQTYYQACFPEGEGYVVGYDSTEEPPLNDPAERSVAGDFEKYGTEFFEENFLVFINVLESSGSNRHKVESIIVDDDALNITIATLVPGGTDDMASWVIMIALDKAYAGMEVNRIPMRLPPDIETNYNDLEIEEAGNAAMSYYKEVNITFAERVTELIFITDNNIIKDYLPDEIDINTIIAFEAIIDNGAEASRYVLLTKDTEGVWVVINEGY